MPKDDTFTGPHWTPQLRDELAEAHSNGQVGSTVVSETDQVRVWLLELAPGARLPFHTHVQDYFWTATTAGRAMSRYSDGRVVEKDYVLGETQHHSYGAGESMTHDLENTGDTVLCFTTVEFLGGANAPLL